VAFLCKRYKVSTSGFYAWLLREGSKRARRDKELKSAIIRIHRENRSAYGSPRIHRQLQREGIHCGAKRVARLMREAGLRGQPGALLSRRKAGVHQFFEKTANLRLGEPAPTAVNQIWVADVTYLRVGKEWRYLATVMDLFSRRIVGWTVSRNRTMHVTLRALKRAIAARTPSAGLVFHSDRGSEYAAYAYQAFLRSRGFVPSMNRPRTCQDNAHMESFFRSLKAECRRAFASDGQLNAQVGSYIERFYNTKRLHSSLGYHSPVEFECLALAQQSVHKIG
jgi:transposase InsO family protein